MSILNITNLTDNPEKVIEDNYLDAFEEVEQGNGRFIIIDY